MKNLLIFSVLLTLLPTITNTGSRTTPDHQAMMPAPVKAQCATDLELIELIQAFENVNQLITIKSNPTLEETVELAENIQCLAQLLDQVTKRTLDIAAQNWSKNHLTNICFMVNFAVTARQQQKNILALTRMLDHAIDKATQQEINHIMPQKTREQLDQEIFTAMFLEQERQLEMSGLALDDSDTAEPD